MTDRYNSFLVTLKHDMRTDDAEPLIKAISLLNGVDKVTPNVTKNFEEYTFRNRLKRELFLTLDHFFSEG